MIEIPKTPINTYSSRRLKPQTRASSLSATPSQTRAGHKAERRGRDRRQSEKRSYVMERRLGSERRNSRINISV